MKLLTNVAVAGAAMLAFAQAAGAVTVVFSATQSNDTPPPSPSPLCGTGQLLVQFDGTNSTSRGQSNFGGFVASQRHCIDVPPGAFTGGVFSYDFDAGDAFFGTYTGGVTPTGTPMVFASVVDFTVTGGTGRFLGATGFIRGVGTVDRRVQRPLAALELTGQLELARVPEPAAWGMMILGFGLVGTAARRRRQAGHVSLA